MYYVYVLESISRPGQLYVGYSTNLKRRLEQHNQGRTRSTKPYAPWKIIFYEAYTLSSDAKRREQYLKTTKGRKALKLMLTDYFNVRPRQSSSGRSHPLELERGTSEQL